MDFTGEFDNAEHADVLLHLSTHVLAESHEPASPLYERSFHCHAVLLSAQSAFFKARLSSTWQQVSPCAEPAGPASQPGRSAKILYELVEQVEPNELPAMEQLLALMYSHKVPEPAPAPELLFQCLRLADRLGAVHCMDLLLHSLASVTADTIDHQILVRACSIPPGAWARPASGPLMAATKSAVTRLFGNVPAVIRSEELQQQFCQLPFAAVLGWAESDDLEVHSENCVVFLLSAWVAAQQTAAGQVQQGEAAPTTDAVAAEQLEQLAHQVRVFHLGPAYQHHVLPHLEWFKGCGSMQHLPTLLMYKRHGLKLTQVLTEAKHRANCNWRGAEQWVARQRRSCGMTGANEPGCPDLSWKLSPAELARLYDGQVVSSPVNHYVNGFLLRAFAQKKQDRRASTTEPEGPACTLGLFCGVDAPAMAAMQLPWSSTSTVMSGAFDMTIVGPDALTYEQHGVPGDGFLMGSSGWGFPDFLVKSAPTIQELLGPYLREHRYLQVAGSFTHVDVVCS